MLKNNFVPAPLTASSLLDAGTLRSVAACHWSHRMLQLMHAGVARPGAMRRQMPGLNQKVQTACLQKMTRLGLLERTSYPEVPPHVEYTLTPMGHEFTALLDGIEALQRRIDTLD